MRILAGQPLEECLDGVLVYRYQFDRPWSREWILALSSLGRLDYFPDFPRPYFRLRGAGGFLAQGVEGDDTGQVSFPRQGGEALRLQWEALFSPPGIDPEGESMGQKLVRLYEFASSAGGPTAQMRLAIKTLVPAAKAAAAPDSPELIAKVRAAIREVTGKEAPGV